MSIAIAPARRPSPETPSPARRSPAATYARRAVIIEAIERYERASDLHRRLEAEFDEGGDEGVGFFTDLASQQVVDAEIALLNCLLAGRAMGEPTGVRDDYHATIQPTVAFRYRGVVYRAVPDAGWGTMILRLEFWPGRGR